MSRVTPLSAKREVYSDFDMELTRNPVSRDLARKTNEESVKQAIKNLLQTDRGERLMQPNVGSDIRKQLFENITPETVKMIESMVRETLDAYEPRAELLAVDVVSSIDSNKVQITVVFNTINSEDDITVQTTLTRVR